MSETQDPNHGAPSSPDSHSQHSGPSSDKPQGLECALRTADLARAQIAISLLESAGIHAVLFDRDMVTLGPLLSSDLGGARVMVPGERLQEAKEILAAVDAGGAMEISDADLEAAALAAKDEGELSIEELQALQTSPEGNLLCPSCGSHETYPTRIPLWLPLIATAGFVLLYYKQLFPGLVLLAMTFGLFFARKRLRDCHACGRRFDPKG
jgi:hypothetical protein